MRRRKFLGLLGAAVLPRPAWSQIADMQARVALIHSGIPVEQLNVFELVINRRTARALGIELPRTLMLQATRVIE